MRYTTRPRRARRLAGAVVTLVLLAGCGDAALPPPVQQSTAAAAPAPAPIPAAALPASHPTRLRIDAIDVDTGLIDLGLQADGTMEVPPDGSTAGWYTASPTPGQLGPAVLAAHVDWQGEQGVFHDLRRMSVGDEVLVDRADGSTARFSVRRVDQYPKDSFPTTAVYGNVSTPQLRLITCGGEFDPAARSYLDNIVVYAEMVA